MIDPAIRLRRAITLQDLALVQRIVRNNPKLTQNPDFEDKSNTSLHLAAKEGSVEIANYLIEAGHEANGISLNADGDTPLMVAVASEKVEVGELLIKQFPRCVPWQNKAGLDALMFCARHEPSTPLIPTLLSSPIIPSPFTSHPPSTSTTLPTSTSSPLPPLPSSPSHNLTTSPTSLLPLDPSSPQPPSSSKPPHPHPLVLQRDTLGSTALHHASASGSLKALRLLLLAGASPSAQNAYSWTPISYSASVAAEVYFKNLVAEMERQKNEVLVEQRQPQAGGEVEGRVRGGSGGRGGGGGGVRLVTEGLDGEGDVGGWSGSPVMKGPGTPTAGSAGAGGGAKTNDWRFVGPQSGGSRGRAGSGE
ncbi:MAG: hypothetical protein M1820_010807 [Bogoriella megaspora]|nr:MAG: hypothetical protein M1820_010807 [Bogoriella megaspora]